MSRLPQDSVGRRRLAAAGALGLTAFVVIVLFAAALLGGEGASPEQERAQDNRERTNRTPAPKPKLSLEQQVGQLLMMSYDGTEVPPFIRRRLEERQGSGVVLFSKNVTDAEQAKQVTAAVQKAAGGSALVATDQEGGELRSLPFAEPESSQGSLTTTDVATEAATAAATDLSESGVNIDLAPVADVADPDGSIFTGRAFPGDGEQVSEMVSATVEALDEGGVAATVKHFPGLGSATINTDDAAVTIDTSEADLEATDLAPFRAAIEAKVPVIMASHAVYSALDGERPASQSPAILDSLLRDELGFRGVVVTDSIEAQAILDRGTVADAAVASIEAGTDLILTTGSGSWKEIQPALVQRAESDPEFRARVAESAKRVAALKRRLELKPAAQ